tara:strand:- start:341 stop:754 length:414 start_codon:yes stop_codon:yes gene_type:complete
MGRVIVHLHGNPSNAKLGSLLEDYSSRMRSKVKIETHNSKLSPEEYLAKLPSTVIVLDERGKEMTSVEFSKQFEDWVMSTDDIHLGIGPAVGFPRNHGKQSISLSKMTLPHEFAAVLLVEQLYRANEISRGTSYHKP